VRFEQRGFGAGRVIFRQVGDRLEQLRPAVIVQPARRDGRDRRGQAGEDIGAEGRVRFGSVEAMLHHASRASLTPENIQR
jgi:hypothetical protein